ncbi:MAG: hypothetical protein M3P83_04420 [Actinomycetota bacterium]|nr:hypothetical protein [Actinomycetota bacterium]
MKMQSRDRDHIAAWRAIATLAKWELEVVREELARAQQKLLDRPVKVVTENLDIGKVRAAYEERDQAYQARDLAFSALSEVRFLHRERDNRRCTCGQRYEHCEIAQIVDTFGSLKRWERKQVERWRRGEPHALPRDHPALRDPQWLDRQRYA